jgi:hypothetical protein
MQRVDLNSSWLGSAAYHYQDQLLEVVLRSGEVYHYFGVPAQTYKELLRAESPGGYLNSHIRNRFAWRQIYPGEPSVAATVPANVK